MRENYELYIAPKLPQRNLVNGRFLPGHVPHNKGKKWADYMNEETMAKVRTIAMNNLTNCVRRNCGGQNAIAVLAMDDDGKILGWFPSAREAGRKMGICSRNIINVLHGKRKHAGGYRWIYA